MAATNIQFEGEIRIRYRIGPDALFPVKFNSHDPEQAQDIALRQSIASMIIEESPVLLGAHSITLEELHPVI